MRSSSCPLCRLKWVICNCLRRNVAVATKGSEIFRPQSGGMHYRQNLYLFRFDAISKHEREAANG